MAEVVSWGVGDWGGVVEREMVWDVGLVFHAGCFSWGFVDGGGFGSGLWVGDCVILWDDLGVVLRDGGIFEFFFSRGKGVICNIVLSL